MEGEKVKVVTRPRMQVTTGRAGLKSHVPGGMATVSNLVNVSGGMMACTLAQRDRK